MAVPVHSGFATLKDPYFSASDYIRLANHRSPAARLWALTRLEELGLEIPEEIFRERLGDASDVVAVTAAEIAGRRRASSLADALLARLTKAEDVVGATCARSLAALCDRRVLAAIGRRSHLPPEERDLNVWVALSMLRGPEATALLREAFGKVPAAGAAFITGILCTSIMQADPALGIPLAVERWAAEADGDGADALLQSLLLAIEFHHAVAGLRKAMEPKPEPPDVSLPEEILEPLAAMLPLGLVGQARQACREGRWVEALGAVLRLADSVRGSLPAAEAPAPALVLVEALQAKADGLRDAEGKARDAAGLILLALDRMAELARAAELKLPEAADDQLRWLLSEAPLPFPQATEQVFQGLAACAPAPDRETQCIKAIERREISAPLAARLLASWRAEGAAPALVEALGADEGLASAAMDALVAIGEAAVGPVLHRLAAAEDPLGMMECLTVCARLPTRRAVEAICRRFEELFIRVPDALLDTLKDIGAREFLDPLGKELREDEAQAEETFALLCALHGVSDPRVPAITARAAERQRRKAEIAADPFARRDHLDLALSCNACRRTYTYPVHAIYVDPEPPQREEWQPFIRDRIRCKGCGREDDYTVSPAANMTIFAELMARLVRAKREGGAAVPAGPVFIQRLGLADGTRMNPREARREYEARLARRPDDPGLLVGYGNILRFLGDAEAAEGAYRRALEIEARAAEAWAGLGQVVEERGDLAAAQEAYARCLATGEAGVFYYEADARGFFEQVKVLRHTVRGALAVRPPDPASRAKVTVLAAADRPGLKVGRNDPCPCGSGKKYKKCCLRQAEMPAGETGGRRDGPDRRLQERLAEYAGSLPRGELERALREFGGERGEEIFDEGGEEEMAAFQEWLIHDFRQATGETVIARFLRERGPALPRAERAILAEWQDAAVGLHEVIDVEPGKGLTLRSVFTGETHRVREVRGSLAAARWDLLGGRLIRVEGEPQLAGVASVFHARDREGLVRYVGERYATYRRHHPEASWHDFFRAEPLIFSRYADEMARNYRPPDVRTAEGHPVMLGRARYEVHDLRRLVAALEAAPDFAEDVGDEAGTREFTWLRTGPAERWVKEVLGPEGGLRISSQRIEDPAETGPTSLAGFRLAANRLTIETISAERLAWAKGRLAELAGHAVRLRSDVVEEWERKGRAAPRAEGPDPPSLPPEVEARIVGQAFHRHFTAWLDEKVPALGGETPRAAAQDPGRRPKLIQLLREIENHQDRARQEGKAWYDISWMWEELGIGRQEA